MNFKKKYVETCFRSQTLDRNLFVGSRSFGPSLASGLQDYSNDVHK